MQLTPGQLSRAFTLASERKLMPTSMGSAEIRALGRSMIEASVISARVTQAVFLSELKKAVESRIGGLKDSDMGKLILEAQKLLQRLGYTPEKGFPGDAALGVPPAKPGSLQDLSSWGRLRLIIETMVGLAQGKAQQIEGFDPISLSLAPGWKYVRLESRRVPRGSPGSSSDSWFSRWIKLKGPAPVKLDGEDTLCALKTDPIWWNLGHDPTHSDTLQTDYSPYAFWSGWGQLPMNRSECDIAGFDWRNQKAPKLVTAIPVQGPGNRPQNKVAVVLPPIPANLNGLDNDIATQARSKLSAAELLKEFDANFLKEVGLS